MAMFRASKRMSYCRPGIEFLESREVPAASLAISGLVYEDLNANGLRDSGEAGISGSPLQLVTRQGVMVGTAATDEAGRFVFDRDSRVTGSRSVISFSGSFNLVSSSPDEVVALPRFDPALGTLTGIEIEVNAQIDVVTSLENLGRSASVLRVTQENSIRVTGPGDAIIANAPPQTFTAALGPHDGVVDFSGSSGIRFPKRSSSVSKVVSLPEASESPAEPVTTESATTEPAFTEPVATEPVFTEPGTPGSGSVDPAPSEPSVPPPEFQSYIGNGSVAFQATVAGSASSQGPGNYQFAVVSTGTATITIRYTYEPSDALKPGDYIVRQTSQPDGFLDGRETADGKSVLSRSHLTDEIPVTLAAASLTRLGFGEVKAASLSGSAFIDANGDGLFDTEEAGAEGAVVTLSGIDDTGANITRQAEIASDALFSFTDLRPGKYSVASSLLPKYMAGTATAGDSGGIPGPATVSAISLGSGAGATGYLLPQIESAAVTGVVYLDRNANGARDEGEPGIANQTVIVTGIAGGKDVRLTAVTDSNGEYTFAQLVPGTYSLTSPASAPYTATGAEAGSLGGTPGLDSITDITLAPGDLADGYLLGRSAQLTISGRVFLDRNASATFDAGDSLLRGVKVSLTGTSYSGKAISRQAVTNIQGTYSFTRLPDGVYRIVAQAAPGTFAGQGVAGTSGGTAGTAAISAIDLGTSGNALGYDFPMLAPSRISGFVYQDRNRDGVRGAGEFGLGGVTMTLTGNDDLGRAIRRTTVTAADGSYNFGNLRSGSYFVSRAVPAGYQAGSVRLGSLGGLVRNGGVGLSLGFGSAGLRYDFAVIQSASGGLSKRLYMG